jgi:uncharacterized protein
VDTTKNDTHDNNKKMFQFLNKKYINIETYKKNDQALRTPVWFVIDSVKIYSRTDLHSGKVKHARNNPHIRVAPSDVRGRPMGLRVDSKITLADSSESELANQLLNQKYGLQGRLVRIHNRLRPIVICVEI